MSASNLVQPLVPNYSFSLAANNAVSNLASSATPKVLLWSGVVTTAADGSATLTWTYANASDPKLFAVGDYVVCQPIALLANSALQATLNAAATPTTQTLVLAAAPAAVTLCSVEVWRTSYYA